LDRLGQIQFLQRLVPLLELAAAAADLAGLGLQARACLAGLAAALDRYRALAVQEHLVKDLLVVRLRQEAPGMPLAAVDQAPLEQVPMLATAHQQSMLAALELRLRSPARL